MYICVTNKQNHIKMTTSKILSKYYGKIKCAPLAEIIELMTPTIEKRVQAIKENELSKKHGRFSEFDQECTTISLFNKLASSVCKYFKNTDKLISLESRTGLDFSFVIDAKVQRKNEIFNFSTEAILAGGYSVQSLHVRYIVKTNLPLDVFSSFQLNFVEKANKKMKFESKLNDEKIHLNRKIEMVKNLKLKLRFQKKLNRNLAIEILAGNLKTKTFPYLLEKNKIDLNDSFFESQSEYDKWCDEKNEENIHKILKTDVDWIKSELNIQTQAVEKSKSRIKKIKLSK